MNERGRRRWAGARRAAASAQPTTPKPPLVRLAADLKAANAERTTWCESTRSSARRSFPKERRPENGHVLGYEAMALDVWCGREFTDRNRSRGWNWVPFYTGDLDATPDTDETVAARVARTYALGGDEKAEHADMLVDPVGTIAATAGTLAARINTYRVWRLEFFDEHSVRVDLTEEVNQVTKRARRLRHQQKVLGPQPQGELRSDDEVVRLYVEKATAIERAVGALYERLTALDSYCDVVASIQRRKNKYDYLARLNGIDDLELLVDDSMDRHETTQIREAASISDALAAV
ncbi:hypothetical protein [uncultured Williamsia sp.]|uniref:hypothetical protein n=1 Tax=uncultured Williamsia sp. TaxID=259311 RepID=UPI002602997B|nr:hypothetical protein [uncultured Williamsia sp.]